MSLKAEFVTATGTIICALGIGFVMQNGEVAELRYGSTHLKTASAVPLVGQTVIAANTIPTVKAPLTVDAITLTSAELSHQMSLFDPALLIKSSLDLSVFEAPGADVKPVMKPALECTVDAVATSRAAAMIALSVEAPCLAGTPVTVRHDEMKFSGILSETGSFTAEIPALVRDALVEVQFQNGEVAEARTEIDSLPLYDRVVVQWSGAPSVQIHAREFGAAYGDEGHVWAGSRRDLTALANGHGGHLANLGDPAVEAAHLAEVYTFPSVSTKMSGAVDLTVETEVTAENCGKDLIAHALQTVAGRKMSSQTVTLAMPACDTIGSFLVLNNLLEDLTVAHR